VKLARGGRGGPKRVGLADEPAVAHQDEYKCAQVTCTLSGTVHTSSTTVVLLIVLVEYYTAALAPLIDRTLGTRETEALTGPASLAY
jgi:hypothetical protein